VLLEEKGLCLAPDIRDVIFNPALESELLAVTYQDGDIVVFEMSEGAPATSGSRPSFSRGIL